MITPDPSLAISAATAPLVLVSGVGILVLTLNTRYIQATSRTREIYDKSIAPDCPFDYAMELDVLYKRCRLLKYSFATLILSTIASSLLVVTAVVDQLVNVSLAVPQILLLTIGCVMILVSMVLLFMDIALSMRATSIHIGRKVQTLDR